ncbi:MAG: hypothetical protein WDO69_22375 [Pseudomonadota bacterium]
MSRARNRSLPLLRAAALLGLTGVWAVACGGPQPLGASGSVCFRADECQAGLACVPETQGSTKHVCSADLSGIISMVDGAVPDSGDMREAMGGSSGAAQAGGPGAAGAEPGAGAAGKPAAGGAPGFAGGGAGVGGAPAGGSASAGAPAGGAAAAGSSGTGSPGGGAGSSGGGAGSSGGGAASVGASAGTGG